MPTRSLPFDCGATLPLVQRYTDQRFRALVRKVNAQQLPPELALELSAFLKLLPRKWAAYIFHWNPRRIKLKGLPESLDMHYANMKALTPEHIVALLQAMREGGWDGKGGPADLILMAMLGFRERGLTNREIATAMGLTPMQVTYRMRRGFSK